ncbi:MAG: hypothetical protein U5K81_00055 [Trueperaceae bacterium]|nr:hypothetical protein [Trueperaceae bacterium]
MSRRLARDEGILAGISTGLNADRRRRARRGARPRSHSSGQITWSVRFLASRLRANIAECIEGGLVAKCDLEDIRAAASARNDARLAALALRSMMIELAPPAFRASVVPARSVAALHSSRLSASALQKGAHVSHRVRHASVPRGVAAHLRRVVGDDDPFVPGTMQDFDHARHVEVAFVEEYLAVVGALPRTLRKWT